jgi:hypothetical protein
MTQVYWQRSSKSVGIEDGAAEVGLRVGFLVGTRLGDEVLKLGCAVFFMASVGW